MTAPITCSNCGAMLNKQWFDHGLKGYDCRACGALTGPAGEAMGIPQRSRVDRRLVAFMALIVISLLLLSLFIAQMYVLPM